ncbi:MAG: ribosomal protein S18-alanine N-acetyltransferase [Dehalococcoidia bacterium]
MTPTTSPVRLRPMTVDDIAAVVEVERASFPTSWPSSAYRRELEQNTLARYIVAVEPADAAPLPPPRLSMWQRLRGALGGPPPPPPPERSERIIGFLGLWFMVDEAHIVTVAVEERHRRRGVGELLVAEAIDLARDRGCDVVTLECRVSNTGAQALYEKYGFARAGIRKRYYTDNGEDALIMTTPSLADAAYRERIEALRRARSAAGQRVPHASDADPTRREP